MLKQRSRLILRMSKKQPILRKDFQQSVPFFSIKSGQTDQAGTAEENLETPGNQNPVS